MLKITVLFFYHSKHLQASTRTLPQKTRYYAEERKQIALGISWFQIQPVDENTIACQSLSNFICS